MGKTVLWKRRGEGNRSLRVDGGGGGGRGGEVDGRKTHQVADGGLL